jgi:hypothetical protein
MSEEMMTQETMQMISPRQGQKVKERGLINGKEFRITRGKESEADL